MGADISFVMDASGSINEENFKKVLDFAIGVILSIDMSKVRVSVITFSDSANLIFPLDRYANAADMISAVRNIHYDRRTTNTAAALRMLRTQVFSAAMGDRANHPNIALVITDGESNNQVETLKEAIAVKTAGIQILTVGIGSWLDINELQNMASFPHQQNMYHVQSFDALPQLTATLRDYVCNNNQVCTTSNPCQNGGRCQNKFNGYECVCPSPYTGRNCTDVCNEAADIIIALDGSGSITDVNFRKALDFLVGVVQSFKINNDQSNSGTRLGMLTFDTNATKLFDLNQYTSSDQVVQALSVNYEGGTTNTAAALQFIRQNMFTLSSGDRPNVRNYILLLTDGQADDSAAAWREARLARASGIQILAVGIGQGVNIVELESIASFPSDRNVLRSKGFDNLDDEIRQQIYQSLCNNNNMCTGMNPCQNGAVCKSLMNSYSCSPCPIGTAGVNCAKRCDGRLDLAFVLDSSGSIRSERFPEVKEFLVNVTKRLDVSPDRVQVAMVYWSDDAKVQFRLNDYHSQQDVINAIRSTPFLGGKTNTASALSLLRTDIFQTGNGKRQNVRNLAVIISDGNSNIHPENTFPEAAADRENSIYIVGVAVGNKFANMVEMEGIVSIPSEKNVFNVERYSDLMSIVSQITDSTCDDQDECNTNPCQNDGICLHDVKRYICRCRPGFTGYNCQNRCSRQLDVVFVLDISGSVDTIYQMTMEFAKEVVYGLDMTGDRTRVGALTFATDYNPHGVFYLNTYPGNKESVINALNFYHNGGRTNTQAGLNAMRTQQFTGVRGDRTGVQNVAILITDGYSNEFESNTIPEADQAKNNGIRIYTVGLGESPNMGELNNIASDPDSEYVYRLRNMTEVQRIARDLLTRLCQ